MILRRSAIVRTSGVEGLTAGASSGSKEIQDMASGQMRISGKPLPRRHHPTRGQFKGLRGVRTTVFDSPLIQTLCN